MSLWPAEKFDDHATSLEWLHEMGNDVLQLGYTSCETAYMGSSSSIATQLDFVYIRVESVNREEPNFEDCRDSNF